MENISINDTAKVVFLPAHLVKLLQYRAQHVTRPAVLSSLSIKFVYYNALL